jgi:capsular exopolysaccharide synthesis family protein
MVIVAGTLLCAAGAALTAVLLRENRACQTVFSMGEIARRGLRPLGLLPYVWAGPSASDAPPDSPYLDAVTSLQAAVAVIAAPDQVGATVLLFTSALPAEGKSTTVAMLAAGLAEAGSKVLLVDGDLRSPSLHQKFGMSLSPGLADCVDMEGDFTALVRRDQATGIALVTAGDQRARPLAILSSPRLRQAVDTWRRSYDFVLIDSPPVLATVDARLLGRLADLSVFVVHWGKTGWTTLGQAIRLQAEGGARIGGVVISQVNVKELAKWDYGYVE